MGKFKRKTAMVSYLGRSTFYSELEFEMFEERAAIFEYEAGLSKALAEQKAWQMILQMRRESELPKVG